MTYRFTTQRGELQREKGEGVISSILVKKRNVSYMLKQTPERHRKLAYIYISEFTAGSDAPSFLGHWDKEIRSS